MKFYQFKQIEEAGSCIRFVRECLGQEVQNDRTQAIWRGGDGFNVALTDRGWYDHKTKEKGGIIKLCAMSKFNGNVQQAQEFLGDWLGLTPSTETVKVHYDYRKQSNLYQRLISEGYSEVKKYVYVDQDGNDRHYVIRMEHPSRGKEFIQCTPYSGSVKMVETVLYNLPIIMDSSWAVVVEGEKDADTLINLGIPATTCNNGAGKWNGSYTETLKGKDIVVCRDNDKAGNIHAHLILRAMADSAKSLRVICPSKREKGDVTDWFLEEGGSLEKFVAMVKSAKVITPEEALWDDKEYAIYQAKKANEEAFANFSKEWRLEGKREKQVNVPRTQMEMVDDIHTRFLGFPRRLGKSTLFDRDKDTKRIDILPNDASVFSWIGEKSKNPVLWKPGVGFSTKGELYHALLRNAVSYEKISEVPNYPMRSDVYYTFENGLKPSANHEAFKRYMSFFNPEDGNSKILMMTMTASMMYYKPGIQRPCWIIDSHGGQAAGKTTFAELTCYLYRCSPIKTTLQEITRDAKELNKRLVSVTGRNSIMLLVDNVRGVFDNPFFSDLVTCFSISGKAPYGIGEESRPNDLTYVITSNSANIGSDMASRSFIFYLCPPTCRGSSWKTDVMSYIDKHRMEILGDIYDILSRGHVPHDFQPKTRVPEFEADVLYKMAGGDEGYEQVINFVLANRDDANVDAERAVLAVEQIKEGIVSVLQGDADDYCVFIRNAVVNYWIKSLNIDVQDIRNMVNTGKIECIDKRIRRYPRGHVSPYLASGIMFIGSNVQLYDFHVPILTLNNEKSVKVLTYVQDIAMKNEIEALYTRKREAEQKLEKEKSASRPFRLPETVSKTSHLFDDMEG